MKSRCRESGDTAEVRVKKEESRMTSTVEGGLIIGPVWKRKRGTAAFFQGSRQAARNPVELTARHWNCSIIQRACSGVAPSWRWQDDVSLAFLFGFDYYSI